MKGVTNEHLKKKNKLIIQFFRKQGELKSPITKERKQKLLVNFEYFQFSTGTKSQTFKHHIAAARTSSSIAHQATAFPHLSSAGGSSREERRSRACTPEERQWVEGEDTSRVT